MKKNFLCFLSLAVISTWVNALDLVSAYDRAKNSDPNWQANVLQYEADQLNLGLAKGNLLPTVTLAGNITRKSQDMNSISIPGAPEVNSDNLMSSSSTTRQASITARQPLFRWDAWEGLKQVKTSVNLSEVTLKVQQQDHILNVSESYFNVLRQQALTAAYLQEEKALLEMYDEIY